MSRHACTRCSWRSPYVSDTYADAQPSEAGPSSSSQLRANRGDPIAGVGNADLVRGISDCLSLTRAASETAPTAEVYEALLAACVRAADTYHWLGDADLGDLRTPLDAVRATAEQVLAEFETVQALTRQAADALAEAAAHIASVVRPLRGEAPRDAHAWVNGLAELRRAQGHLLTLKELRYADTVRIDELAADAEADLASFGQRAVSFLAREDAFTGHHQAVERLVAEAESLTTVAEAAPVTGRIDELTDGLRTVTEVVAGLDIADATVRTSVLERVAQVLGGVNRARATLEARRRELLDHEGRAEFAAEFALLGQSVTSALTAAGSPQSATSNSPGCWCRWRTWKPASRSSTTSSASWRTGGEVYEAFAARKQTLADARARRAEQSVASAYRVLETVGAPGRRARRHRRGQYVLRLRPDGRQGPAHHGRACAISATGYGRRHWTAG